MLEWVTPHWVEGPRLAVLLFGDCSVFFPSGRQMTSLVPQVSHSKYGFMCSFVSHTPTRVVVHFDKMVVFFTSSAGTGGRPGPRRGG